MAKILTADEILELVDNSITDESFIADVDQFRTFLGDLSEVLVKHFGGTVGSVDYSDDLGYNVAIHYDSSIPDDGGVWKAYDTDVNFEIDAEND